MAYGNNVVTAPVSFGDVNRALGSSHTDLASLCTDAHIKYWAKFKPVDYNKVAPLTDAERASVNYGLINIPTWSNINKMANFWLGLDTSSTNYPDCAGANIPAL